MWRRVQGRYSLQAGDSVVFAKQQDGTLVVCGMHAKGDRVALPSIPKAPRQAITDCHDLLFSKR